MLKPYLLRNRLGLAIGFDEDDVGDEETIEVDWDPDLLIDDDCFRI